MTVESRTARPGPVVSRTPARGTVNGNTEENPFRSSPARKTLDTLAISSGTVEAVGTVAGTTRALETVAESMPALSGVAARVAARLTRVLSVGGQVVMEWPLLMKAGQHVSRLAPFLGLGVAIADVAKARIECDPKLKRIDEGQALFSVISGVAGLVAAAGSTFGVAALSPLVTPMTVLAVGVTVVNVVDGVWCKGAIARATGTGLRKLLNLNT